MKKKKSRQIRNLTFIREITTVGRRLFIFSMGRDDYVEKQRHECQLAAFTLRHSMSLEVKGHLKEAESERLSIVNQLDAVKKRIAKQTKKDEFQKAAKEIILLNTDLGDLLDHSYNLRLKAWKWAKDNEEDGWAKEFLGRQNKSVDKRAIQLWNEN